MGELIVKGMPVGMLDTNCYILMDAESREGYIIDPGAQARKIVDISKELRLNCLGILCTHGHMDHIGVVGSVSQALGAPVLASTIDSGCIDGSIKDFRMRMGSHFIKNPTGIKKIGAGDSINFGEYKLRVLETPGHTSGSLSFLCDGNLFCGDLVFRGSVGRTDFRGGSEATLLESIQREVLSLPDDVVIYPGHGPSTTVGEERASNPYLRGLRQGS